MITVTPLKIDVAGTIRRIRNQRFPVENALMELIDNSLDAKATEIKIQQYGQDLIISDNGEGFSDPSESFNIGQSSKTEGIGRYGVGLKDASIKYSKETVIFSRGKCASCDWEEAIQTGLPQIILEEGPTWPGSKIEWRGFMSQCRRSIKTEEIQRTYAPFLSGIGSISINGIALPPLPLPVFTESIDSLLEYEEKSVHIKGGIFSHSDPARRDWKGYHIFYNGRLIGSGKILNSGTGDINCANFCFCVEILDSPEGSKWVLATNKDAVEGQDELLDYIFHSVTRPILKRAEQESIDVETRQLVADVESIFNENGNITRGPRKNTSEAKKEHKPGSPKARTFSATREGEYHRSNTGKPSKGGLQLSFHELDNEALGEVACTKKLLVTLNKSNPFIAANMKSLPVMKAVAVLIYGFHRSIASSDLAAETVVNNALGISGQSMSFSDSE